MILIAGIFGWATAIAYVVVGIVLAVGAGTMIAPQG